MTALDAPRYEVGSPQYRSITLALFLAGVVTFALLYSTQALLATLVAQFDVSPATSALSVSVTTGGLGLALLIAGPLSEVTGRTPLMFTSLFAAAVVGIACGLAPTWPLLLALRALQGLALAGLPAVAMAYLSEEVVAGAQARAAGVYIAGTALGGMSGRLATSALTDLLGWRVALIALGLIALVCAGLVVMLLPRSRHFTPAPAGWGQLRRSIQAILTDPGLLCLFGIGGTAMGAFVGAYNAIGFRLQAAPYQLSVGQAGLVFLSYALGSLASARAGAWAQRRGRRTVAPYLAAAPLVGLALTAAAPLPVVIAGLVVVTMGFFGLHGVVSGWVAARATVLAGVPGQASSAYLVAYYSGSSIVGMLAGVAWSGGGWAAVVGLCGSLFAATLGLTLALRRIPVLAGPS